MKRSKWKHTKDCTEHTCVCAKDGQQDPVCDCGNPAWACECDEERVAELMDMGCTMKEAICCVAFDEAQAAWAELDITLCCHDYDEATLRAAKRAFEVLKACLERRAQPPTQ